MNRLRVALPLMALLSLTAGLAGCGEQVGNAGPVLPARFQTYRSEPAPALPAGIPVMAGLEQRSLRPPAVAADCPVSSSAGALEAVAPDYGSGVGPVYLTGQDSWYAAGQAAFLMVDRNYSGPLLVRTFHVYGDGSTVAFTDLSTVNVADKESRHGVTLVPAVHTSTGGLFLAGASLSSSWRAWFGELSADGPGCFGLQVDGDVFTEFVVFTVNAGSAPPG